MLNSVFVGNPGNSGDPAVYQSQSPNIVAHENQAVLDYIAARKASNTNYYELASTSLNPAQTYGSLNQPVVLIITDSSLKLSASLTGFGILQVPNDFEISSTLQWTGIVMVRSSVLTIRTVPHQYRGCGIHQWSVDAAGGSPIRVNH